jgi:hypothetical protein
MISHKHRLIFLHIPRCAGSSIEHTICSYREHTYDWRVPNYDILFGWCPRRKIHLQHATAQQLLELELVSEKIWSEYFKFSYVRNPWDRALSDYLWMQNHTGIKDTFHNYILKRNKFALIMNNHQDMNFRGDHLLAQHEYLVLENSISVDFIGRFETIADDWKKIQRKSDLDVPLTIYSNKSNKVFEHYSHFYTSSRKRLIDIIYQKDMQFFNYFFKKEHAKLSKKYFFYKYLRPFF